jgi:alpha-mannosidase
LRLQAAVAALLVAAVAGAQGTPDLTKEPTLYVVGYAHLDTEWRWEYPRTISEYLPDTLHKNFALFEKYPHYIFNFSGANRYRMMKEYYPRDFATLQRYVREGRWFPSGSSMEECDVNSPSAESILRQILYGSRYFRRELGRTSAEFMLPDSFGFPASLPALLAHAGIRGFSTQKLTWGSAVGIPFNVGIWEGPDGSGVIAAFNPGSYAGDITYDLTSSEAPPNLRSFVDWPARVRRNGETGGLFTDFHYYGVGDIGGAPRESSIKLVESLVTRQAPLKIVSATAEQMFVAIRPEQTAKLPRFKGDLELTEHSAGSLTSQAYQKRWNRRNELLADAAEKASVAAAWLGGRPYPQQRLENAWTLVMGGQFHDIAAGTATPKAHQYAWNDEVLAANQFAAVLASASESVASMLDTRTTGTPVVVFNPLNVEREDVVEAALPFDGVRVFGPDGREVAAQVSNGKVVFVARVPSVGFAVYDVRDDRSRAGSPAVAEGTPALQNDRYRLRIDENGDVASIFDKTLKRELLSAPIRLAMQTENPHDWPAWNMDWKDRQKPPRAFVQGPARVRMTESGPARVALEVAREAEGSQFVQTIRLAGDRIEFVNAVDWKGKAASLKATFPFAAANRVATYNWGAGTVQRPNNHDKQYEVASHQWIDLTDAGGGHGVTLLSGHKYGSDKPDDRTLRLTLLYTPGLGDGNGRAFSDQATQDWGHHEIVYGLTAHAGTRAGTDWQALRLEQPLIAFEAGKHAGSLGRRFSLARLNTDRARVMALKKAEDSDEVIVRIVELDGKAIGDVRLLFAAPVRSAREVNGQEQPIRATPVDNGQLVTSLAPYQIRTFAVRLADPPAPAAAPKWSALPLAHEVVVASSDGTSSNGGFDGAGRALPAEMLPRTIEWQGVEFHLGAGATASRGQAIPLPDDARRVYILAAADGDRTATFRIGATTVTTMMQNWTGFIGQWDTRLWERRVEQLPPRPDAPPNAPPRRTTAAEFVTGISPGFVKPAPVAWFASHRHTSEGANEPYDYSYLFAHSFDVPAGAAVLTLPDDPKIRVLAITTSNERAPIRPVQPLYDTLAR